MVENVRNGVALAADITLLHRRIQSGAETFQMNVQIFFISGDKRKISKQFKPVYDNNSSLTGRSYHMYCRRKWAERRRYAHPGRV